MKKEGLLTTVFVTILLLAVLTVFDTTESVAITQFLSLGAMNENKWQHLCLNLHSENEMENQFKL